ncbi:MAG: pyridoxamine 5'-phosphate oxidase family protein [Prevotellaceae bacterium]|nr:pyridoxamine 5'-phosphate oxidase family protein [Prevotellaceae bacterium]
MKRIFSSLLVFLLVACINESLASNCADTLKTNKSMQEVYDFLKKCGHYFIATADGNQPRVRPFGTAVIFENKLYIQTGKKKNVSRQMKSNPMIEICALDLPSGKWLRIAATVVNDDRVEAKQYVLDRHPELKSMYSATDSNTQVLYLKDAVATFSSLSGESREIRF